MQTRLRSLWLGWDWIGRAVPGRDRVEGSYCLARLGGADGACGGCPAGNVGQTDDVVNQGLNLNVQVSVDASFTRPELRRVGEQ